MVRGPKFEVFGTSNSELRTQNSELRVPPVSPILLTRRRLRLTTFMQEGVCMKWILVFCAAMAMTGCGGRWTQEGKGYIETHQDSAACSDTILKEQKDLNAENMKICMEAKGYRRSTAERVGAESAPPPAEVPTPKTDAAP